MELGERRASRFKRSTSPWAKPLASANRLTSCRRRKGGQAGEQGFGFITSLLSFGTGQVWACQFLPGKSRAWLRRPGGQTRLCRGPDEAIRVVPPAERRSRWSYCRPAIPARFQGTPGGLAARIVAVEAKTMRSHLAQQLLWWVAVVAVPRVATALPTHSGRGQ